jgi:hypothetical protein
VSKLIYFHKNNFGGKASERGMIFAVLNSLPHDKGNFRNLKSGAEYNIDLRKIYANVLIKQYKNFKPESNEDRKKIEGILANITDGNGRINCKLEKKNGSINCPGLDKELKRLSNSDLYNILIGGILCMKSDNVELCDYLIYKVFDNNSLNDVAKAVIRLVTLGIITDYTYDYNKQTFSIRLGSLERNKIREKYLEFVNG